MNKVRLLIKPAIFTIAVCGECFAGAAIVQYENRKPNIPSPLAWLQSNNHDKTFFNQPKFIELRQIINRWTNGLTTGEKIAGCTIFANFIVLCGWQVNRLRPMMTRFFLSHATETKIKLSPMILSCFSHASPLHFALNMYVVYSFSKFANALLGPEQLVGLFLSAGVLSSFASIAFRLATKSSIPSLGASGALLGIIAYICAKRPETELLVFFYPMAAGDALKLLVALDCIGILARWRILDHAAHLGGSLCGIWYAYYGEKLFHEYRRDIVRLWLKTKRRVE